MTCPAYENRLDELEDYLEGRASAAASASLQIHLQTCAECREELDSAATGTRWVRAGVEPAAAASGPFWTRMGALLRAAEERRRARRDFFGSLEWLAWRAALAALMLAVFLGGYVVTHPPARTDRAAGVFQEPEHPQNDDEVLVTLATRRNGNGR